MQYRLSTVFSAAAAVCAILAVWIAYNSRDRSLKLESQSLPRLSLSARSERQEYELEQNENTLTVRSTFESNYPSQVWPRVEWSFRLSNGVAIDRWKCDDLVLDWDMQSLTATQGLSRGIPHETEVYEGFTIEKYWWISESDPQHVVQNLHIFLIENERRRILAEHKLKIVVDVVVPPGAPE